MTAPAVPGTAWRVPLVLGGVVLVGGLVEAAVTDGSARDLVVRLAIALVMAAAVALARHRPGLALAATWLAGLVQVVGEVDVTIVQFALVVVAFSAARWGSTPVVWLGGLSVPVGASVAVGWIYLNGSSLVSDLVGLGPPLRSLPLSDRAIVVGLALVGLGILAVPFLIGLALRSSEQAARSRELQRVAEQALAQADVARRQAQEIAELRAAQTALTRDVHDVVGHSLAVILAQAESAQFLPRDDTDRVRDTLAAIAVSARQSLRDVRQVLSSTDDSSPAPVGDVDDLLGSVRAAGAEVRSTVTGTPRALPPALETLVFRVVQELVTNALKHGRRGAAIEVDRRWGDELRIEVRNTVDDDAVTGNGMGLSGVRTRVASVGGRLHVERADGCWTAVAFVPIPVDRP